MCNLFCVIQNLHLLELIPILKQNVSHFALLLCLFVRKLIIFVSPSKKNFSAHFLLLLKKNEVVKCVCHGCLPSTRFTSTSPPLRLTASLSPEPHALHLTTRRRTFAPLRATARARYSTTRPAITRSPRLHPTSSTSTCSAPVPHARSTARPGRCTLAPLPPADRRGQLGRRPGPTHSFQGPRSEPDIMCFLDQLFFI